MKFFRKLITYRKLGTLLAIGMLLRSIVAVGYMLDTNPDNGNLFSIILCEGPAGINAIADLSNDNNHHHGHTGHHADHNNTDNEHDHAVQDHPASSCSFWSASSLSLLTNSSFIDSSNYFLSDEIIIYESHLKLRLTNHSGFARAPPTFI
jgi:hypothetical protein